ncbi:transcriptional regulator [Pseudomonas aeruginosa]|nr:transcriptional regulator [Pseudomonas aeruginosa]
MLIDEEITLKKLETFLAFMRTGNLARAAAELGTSNVSVHRAIHSLESALRCPLFKHEGRNLTPLESAYVLEERAQKLVQEVLDTVRLTREAAGFSAERFKLGALYSLTVKTVPQLIMGLKLRRQRAEYRPDPRLQRRPVLPAEEHGAGRHPGVAQRQRQRSRLRAPAAVLR